MSWLDKYAYMLPAVEEKAGASGYFSTPELILDPQLFDGKAIKPHVRDVILETFYDYMSTRYHDVREWTMVWLAGSGASYQWSADRGNGDLDVLFGINFTRFLESNPEFQGLVPYEIEYIMDDDLRNNLWPKTAITLITRGDDRPYEITYYMNSSIEFSGDGIASIHPYAAYNLSENHWTTEPERNPRTDIPREFEEQAQRNVEEAKTLQQEYNFIRARLDGSSPTQRHNYVTELHQVVSKANALFDQIHTNRKQAFGPSGKGYHDFWNYQWQAAKRDGIINILNTIGSVGDEAQTQSDLELYGGPIEDAQSKLIIRAIQSQGR